MKTKIFFYQQNTDD